MNETFWAAKMKRSRSFSDEEVEKNKKILNKKIKMLLKSYFKVNELSLKLIERIERVAKDYINILAPQNSKNQHMFLTEEIYKIIETLLREN